MQVQGYSGGTLERPNHWETNKEPNTAHSGWGSKESQSGTYSAHEVQECGSDGWVGLHGVMHDQDGWL